MSKVSNTEVAAMKMETIFSLKMIIVISKKIKTKIHNRSRLGMSTRSLQVAFDIDHLYTPQKSIPINYRIGHTAQYQSLHIRSHYHEPAHQTDFKLQVKCRPSCSWIQ